jgi:hypothetical protein
MNDAIEVIGAQLNALCPLFYVGSPDRRVALRTCLEAASKQGLEAHGYSVGKGLWQPGGHKPKKSEMDPVEMLDHILDANGRGLVTKRKLFLLEHFDLLLDNCDPLLLTKLQMINDFSPSRHSVIITGRPNFRLPEIIADIPRVSMPGPNKRQIQTLLSACDKNLSSRESIRLADILTGLTSLE